MVLLLFFLYFSIVQYIRIVVEPLEKNAPHLAISRLRDALSYKAVNMCRVLLYKNKKIGGRQLIGMALVVRVGKEVR